MTTTCEIILNFRRDITKCMPVNNHPQCVAFQVLVNFEPSKTRISMDGSEDNQTPDRLQELVKKINPNVLRNRIRNLRKFVVAVVTNRSKYFSRREGAPSGKVVQTLKCERVPASQYRLSKVAKIVTESDDDNHCESQHTSKTVKELEDMQNGMEIFIPDVIVQKDDIISSIGEDEHGVAVKPTSGSQLSIDVESNSRNKSPVTVQEWVDSLPLTPECASREECDTTIAANLAPNNDNEADTLTLGAEAGHLCSRKTSISGPVNVTITGCHEPSEVDSHCSSVDSLLEARKPDPEEILLSLGFGGTASSSYLETGRVPKRFLSPSQLKGVDIEEFIRQQQDLIYTFESGFYGYRGLAGPSHSNPSVIVAKILEKLREHEKETVLMNSYHPDFRKRCSIDQNVTENQPKKFSKIARNVLTKIRCTPGSVLSPDNRRWLDSQGKKSPEIARRLILGQQSFTFGHDGDLIESFDVQNTDCDSTNFENSPQVGKENASEQDLEHLQTESGIDLSLESMILPLTGQEENNNIDRNTSSENSIASTRLEDRFNNNVISSGNSMTSTRSYDRLNENNASHNISTTASISSELLSRRLNEDRQEQKTAHSCIETNRVLSLQDELDNFTYKNYNVNISHNLAKKTRNVLTRYNSFEEVVKENSEDEVKNTRNLNQSQYSGNVEYFSDSATESEFATYPHKILINKNINKQYEELILLESKIKNSERPSNLVTREQFLSLSVKQRMELQSRMIREALETYLNQLKDDDINQELRNCLSNEARKVSDLLDGNSDSPKLTIIVRQMTLLLQQQNRLSAQIKELSVVEKKPSSCHEMCDHILKRVQELELLVQQNAQELAHMKNQLLSKK